jgi:hypothetical protein
LRPCGMVWKMGKILCPEGMKPAERRLHLAGHTKKWAARPVPPASKPLTLAQAITSPCRPSKLKGAARISPSRPSASR